MLEFICVTSSPAVVDKDTRQKVRSQAMKDYRHRQRTGYAKQPKKQCTIDAGRAKRQPLKSSFSVNPIRCQEDKSQHKKVGVKAGERQLTKCSLQPKPEGHDYPTQEVAAAIRRAMQDAASGKAAITSPKIYRLGCCQVLFREFLPQEPSDSKAFANKMDKMTQPMSESMRAANDALALLNLGTAAHDDRIILEGRKRHVAALQALRAELQDSHADWNAIQSATQQILLCEVYAVVSHGHDSWDGHVKGILAITRRRANSHATPLMSFTFHKLRLAAAMQGLLTRQPCSEGLEAREALYHPISQRVECLLRLVMQLPSLLQQADTVIKLGDAEMSAGREIQWQLTSLEADFSEWLTMFRHDNVETLEDYEETPMNDFESVLLAPVGQSDAFTQALRFTSFLQATYYCIFWMCLVQLRRARFDLTCLMHGKDSAEARYTSQRVADCADSLCQSAPYFLDTAKGTICRALAVRAPLYFASQWYEKREEPAKLGWCRALENSIRAQTPHLSWEALLHWGFYNLSWLAF